MFTSTSFPAFTGCALFLAFAVLPAAQAAPRVERLDLPRTGGEASLTQAQDVSDTGTVVAGYRFQLAESGMRQTAFRWTAHDGLQSLPALPGGGTTGAQAVSADGSVIVGFSDGQDHSGRGFRSHAVRWNARGAAHDLGALAGGDDTAATGVSSHGVVIVGYGKDHRGQRRALLWRDGMPAMDLGTLGGLAAIATDVSRDGDTAVGGARDASGRTRAFLWVRAHGMRDLGALADKDHAMALAVSASGDAVVGYCAEAIQEWGASNMAELKGFIWLRATGSMREIVNNLGGTWTQPLGVADGGSVVVGVAQDARGDTHAFRWTPTEGMRVESTLPQALRMQYARGLSSDGRFSVGRLAHDNGAFRADWR
ncbi:hypothetical protein [Paludibacterium sp.]|uniref:hypothetical protein n=1 Tax=Paludibacterium sp. TaxID=1917523 RepID=UPI0025DF15DE|nr:hypothetical protein [Paludibacterium sp.]MBV8647433.1 hypothetical protein [Paludibacterium sp.]